MVNTLRNELLKLRKPNGMYIASTGEHYQHVWIRDCFYEALPELELCPQNYKQTYQSILDFYIREQKNYKKFYHLIVSPWNKQSFEYPHPRCTPDLEEIHEPWGNKQLDVFGEVLYGIWLGESRGIEIIRNSEDIKIINLIIEFLEATHYWECPDNGIWEEYEEVHASSVGACVAGLTAIKLLDFEVPQWLIDKGHETLNRLLPRESESKFVDLALLTLIYPFNIVDTLTARKILHNVEEYLTREWGVIRYIGDMYYNIANPENVRLLRYYDPLSTILGGEMHWCFGFAFLAECYATLGDFGKASYYQNQVLKTIENGKIAEGRYANIGMANENNPLGWSISMAIQALSNNHF